MAEGICKVNCHIAENLSMARKYYLMDVPKHAEIKRSINYGYGEGLLETLSRRMHHSSECVMCDIGRSLIHSQSHEDSEDTEQMENWLQMVEKEMEKPVPQDWTPEWPLRTRGQIYGPFV